MEERVLTVLEEGSHAPEQIAAILRVSEATVRQTLESLRDRGHVDVSLLFTKATADPKLQAAYWRITDTGRARLEALRAEQ